ncbi:MAG: cupin domain-containing protein, partial [Hyphomicrobium sp.]
EAGPDLDPAGSGAARQSLKPAGDVPAPLVPFAGDTLDAIAWRRLAPGVHHFPIPLSPGTLGNLRLIKVAPGAVLPEHGHEGSELTLVLKGSYTDKTGRYGAGDVADLSDGTVHQPVADPNEGCVCLIASDRKIRFKSVIARIMQPFTGY